MQRFLQLDPSWLRNGQTTSLLASVIEKDEVKEDLGGILMVSIALTPPSEAREVKRGWWAVAVVAVAMDVAMAVAVAVALVDNDRRCKPRVESSEDGVGREMKLSHGPLSTSSDERQVVRRGSQLENKV